MAQYVYDGEFNAPMNGAAVDSHEPDIKEGRMMIMDHTEPEETLPFTDVPKKCCWTCYEYDGDRCHKYWNNNEEDYYLPDRDDKKPDEVCEDWTYAGDELLNGIDPP